MVNNGNFIFGGGNDIARILNGGAASSLGGILGGLGLGGIGAAFQDPIEREQELARQQSGLMGNPFLQQQQQRSIQREERLTLR